jgi:hypothetical protein
MKIVPARVEQYVNRVDRKTSLIVGIFCAVGALFCVFRLVLALFAVTMLSSVGWSSPCRWFSGSCGGPRSLLSRRLWRSPT